MIMIKEYFGGAYLVYYNSVRLIKLLEETLEVWCSCERFTTMKLDVLGGITNVSKHHKISFHTLLKWTVIIRIFSMGFEFSKSRSIDFLF